VKEFVGGEVRVMRRIVGEGRERVIRGKVFRDDITVRVTVQCRRRLPSAMSAMSAKL